MRLARLMLTLAAATLVQAAPASAATVRSVQAGPPVAVVTAIKTKVKRASHAVHRHVVADARKVKRASRAVRNHVAADAHKVKRAVVTDAHKVKRAVRSDAHKVKRASHDLHRKVAAKISAWRARHRVRAT